MTIEKGKKYRIVSASPGGLVVCDGIFVVTDVNFDDGTVRYIFTDALGIQRYVSSEDPNLPFDKIRELTKLEKALYEE